MLNFRITDWNPPAYVIALEIAVGLLVPAARRDSAGSPGRSHQRGLGAQRHRHLAQLRARADRPGLGLIRGLPRPVALSLRNTFLRKGRLALTLTTLILASAVVMGVLSVRASTLQTVEDIGAFWIYDAQVFFGQPEPGVDLEREAKRVAGVTEVETRLNASASLKRAGRQREPGHPCHRPAAGLAVRQPDHLRGALA